jgi:hypothetical protein
MGIREILIFYPLSYNGNNQDNWERGKWWCGTKHWEGLDGWKSKFT